MKIGLCILYSFFQSVVFSQVKLDTTKILIKEAVNLHLNRVNNLYFIEHSSKKANQTICIKKYVDNNSISYFIFENKGYEQVYYFINQKENPTLYDTLVVAKFSLYKSLVNPDFACYIDVKGNYFYYNKVLGGFNVQTVSNSIEDDLEKNHMEYVNELNQNDSSIYVDFLDESCFLAHKPPKINLNQVINSEGYLPLVSFYNSKQLEDIILDVFKIQKMDLKLMYFDKRTDALDLYCVYSIVENDFLQKRVVKLTIKKHKEISYSLVGLITLSGKDSEISFLSLKYEDVLNFYPRSR
jgi:hypothetical protein